MDSDQEVSEAVRDVSRRRTKVNYWKIIAAVFFVAVAGVLVWVCLHLAPGQ